jgi:phosphoribosylformylglycinamidine synthase I
MTRPNVAVLYAPGTFCHEETCYALECAGGEGTVVLLSDLLQGVNNLDMFDALVIPGGSSWGDHLGGGRVFAIHLVSYLGDMFTRFLKQNKPVLGIANGCQVLLEAGFLPQTQIGARSGASVQNQSARFESRWVDVVVSDVESLWTKGLTGMVLKMPVASGQMKFMFKDDANVKAALKYVDNEKKATLKYPVNPAGSPEGIAGLVDETGLIMGLILHPERAVVSSHGSIDGLRIFENMIEYCKNL